jgi:4-methyl-5(b-hydroxyethyl)-thiazole monophosphate biosynthesis
MKVMIILANGFEDTEAIATIDVLKRSKIDVDLISMENSLEITTQYNLRILSEKLLKDVLPSDYDALIIPGGKAVFNVLDKNILLPSIIRGFVKEDKLVAAICAGPSQVGKLGLYKNHNYTCFPTTEKSITEGTYLQNQGVVRDGNFITAKSMAYAIDFGLEIIQYLLGENQRELVRKSIYGEE